LKVAQESLKKQNEILEEKVLERTKELTQAQIEIVKRLGLAAEYRDEETGQHIKRMSEFCLLLSQSAGLPKAICNRIALAATMHDVGKIGISDLILFKPGKLDENEFEEIKTHTTIGARLLSGGKSSLLKEAQSVAWTHHEKWDGTGYPRGLKGEKIPLAGRIACICDVFDALISKRPYKEAWPVPKAMEEIKACSGRHFDPKLVELFVGLESELKKIVQDMGAQ
jgi:putative two-component system response regulator